MRTGLNKDWRAEYESWKVNAEVEAEKQREEERKVRDAREQKEWESKQEQRGQAEWDEATRQKSREEFDEKRRKHEQERRQRHDQERAKMRDAKDLLRDGYGTGDKLHANSAEDERRWKRLGGKPLMDSFCQLSDYALHRFG